MTASHRGTEGTERVRVVAVAPGAAELAAYGEVPIAFEVRSEVEVGEDGAVRGERPVAPWTKDYDADGERPAEWGAAFDVSGWMLFVAWSGGRRAGGAAVALRTPGVEMLEGRDDLAVLWDLRVHPAARGRGVGRALFRAAEEWARAAGCRDLKVETQNVNAPACRFYARQGCTLAEVRRGAYPALPREVQLIWRKRLA